MYELVSFDIRLALFTHTSTFSTIAIKKFANWHIYWYTLAGLHHGKVAVFHNLII